MNVNSRICIMYQETTGWRTTSHSAHWNDQVRDTERMRQKLSQREMTRESAENNVSKRHHIITNVFLLRIDNQNISKYYTLRKSKNNIVTIDISRHVNSQMTKSTMCGQWQYGQGHSLQVMCNAKTHQQHTRLKISHRLRVSDWFRRSNQPGRPGRALLFFCGDSGWRNRRILCDFPSDESVFSAHSRQRQKTVTRWSMRHGHRSFVRKSNRNIQK